jgi:hypothetical protein
VGLNALRIGRGDGLCDMRNLRNAQQYICYLVRQHGWLSFVLELNKWIDGNLRRFLCKALSIDPQNFVSPGLMTISWVISTRGKYKASSEN